MSSRRAHLSIESAGVSLVPSREVNQLLDLPKALLKPKEAAAILACSERQVYNLVAQGHLEPVRVGTLIRIAPTVLAGVHLARRRTSLWEGARARSHAA